MVDERGGRLATVYVPLSGLEASMTVATIAGMLLLVRISSSLRHLFLRMMKLLFCFQRWQRLVFLMKLIILFLVFGGNHVKCEYSWWDLSLKVQQVESMLCTWYCACTALIEALLYSIADSYILGKCAARFCAACF